MVFYPIDEIRKAVGLGVQVGGIDLEHIPCKNDLCIFSSSRNNGFDFVRGEVLSLIDDEENIGQRPSAYVGEWLDDQFFLVDQLGDFWYSLSVSLYWFWINFRLSQSGSM